MIFSCMEHSLHVSAKHSMETIGPNNKIRLKQVADPMEIQIQMKRWCNVDAEVPQKWLLRHGTGW